MNKNLLKLICVLTLALGLNTSSIAQLVHIPDSAFRVYLNQNFGACMVGDSIDSSCPAVLAAKIILVSNRGISNLSGIEVFVNDTLLYCHNNLLTSLPTLPPTLKQLRCWTNQITSFPTLPATLTQLYCNDNQLSSLPNLPSSLTKLYCQTNQLTSLPLLPNSITDLTCSFNQLSALPSLPISLNYLFCHQNQLTNLPSLPPGLVNLLCGDNLINTLPTLPASLNYLSCEDNQLTSIPNLPPALNSLNCRNNQITSLPPLPQSLFGLNCNTNQLTSLPNLPMSLNNLSCSENQLSYMPALPTKLNYLYCPTNQLNSLPNLPDSLIELICSENQISTLPVLPSSLSKLWCNDNPIACLPKLNNVTNLNFDNTQITCLPTYGILQSSIPSFSGYPTCDIFNTNGCEVYWNIEGTTYIDGNTNCIKDTNEVPFRNQKISLYKNAILDQQTYTNIKGEYDFDTFSFDNYFTVFSTSVIPFNVYCPLSGVYLDSISVTDSMKYDRDFALTCNGIDLAATSIFSPQLRAASIREIKIQAGDYSNNFGAHCAAGISGTVNITITGPCNYYSPGVGALTPNSIIGNVLTYNIADFGLISYDSSFNFNILVDTTATLGSQIQIQVTISTSSLETNYYNNLISESFTVVGSYDPNDKSVYPDSTLDISGERWLVYTIRFQNTGTASAEHIYITDTLSNKLDRTTFTLLSYSHEPLTQIYPTGLIKFNFPHINLPDSNSNEPESHGYIQFKIKAKPGLLVGSIIQNTANIFFDFNAPVITNTTSNIVINCSIPPTTINADICEGDSFSLNNALYFNDGIYQQKFITTVGCDSIVNLNLNVIPLTNQISITICDSSYYNFNGQLVTLPGVYTDTLINFLGCDSIIELQLTVSSITNIISQSSAILQTTASGSAYQWIDCATNTAIASATNSTYQPTQSGNYAVAVTYGNCVDTSSCFSFSMVGLPSSIGADVIFQTRYNSNADNIQLHTEKLKGSKGVLRLMDISGRILFQKQIENITTGNLDVEIPAKGMNAGIYLVNLITERDNISGKVVKY